MIEVIKDLGMIKCLNGVTRRHYFCKCLHCGKVFIALADNVKHKTKPTRSCGCQVNNGTHNMTSSRAYNCWLNMKQRCYNPNRIEYPNYGGRGITICEQWLNSFETFLADMGNPDEGYSIERKNNNLGYSPENCIWGTKQEQNKNRRRLGTAIEDISKLTQEQHEFILSLQL